MGRRRLVLGGTVLLLLAAVSLVYLLTRPAPLGPANLVRYFPEREATVLYIDVNALRSSGVLDRLVGSTVGEASEYRQFIRDSGFNYKKDLDRVVLNSAGGVHYMVLQGRFDWDKLRSYATRQGGTCHGDECYLKGTTADRVISWRRLRSDLMAVASARDEAAARAVEPRRQSEPATWLIPAAPLWLEVPGQVLNTVEELPPGTRVFAKALQAAERAVFTLGPEENQFALNADVICRTAEEAAVLRSQLEGLTKMLSSLIQRENKNPSTNDLSGVLTSGRFERQDRRVLGHWSVPKAFIYSLGSGS